MIVNEVMYRGHLLGKVLKVHTAKDPGLNFITPEVEPLQLGIYNLEEGQIIKSHVHKNVPRNVDMVQETIYVISGKLDVTFYFDTEVVTTCHLFAGDALWLRTGGHGFKAARDTRLFYTKQGPYLGKEDDKVVI